MPRQTKISCIGMSYIEPIMSLYKILKKQRFTGYSPTQVSSRENGYCVSIIVLAVLLIESLTNRVKYLEKSREPKNIVFFSSKFPNETEIINKLHEIYVVRDLLVHNHIWKISYQFDSTYNEVKIYKQLLKGYGDKKYKKYVNKRDKTTKKLKINVNPIKVGKSDMIKVLTFAKEFLKFMENHYQRKMPLSNSTYKYNNREMNFYELVDKIEKENS